MKARSVFATAAFGCLGLSLFVTAAAANETVTKVVVAPKASEVVIRMRRSRQAVATVTFALPADAVIHLGSNTNAALANLAVGQVAHVRYTVQNGVWLAHEIVVSPPPGSHPPKASAGELHTHGAIVSYNPSAGLLSIKRNR